MLVALVVWRVHYSLSLILVSVEIISRVFRGVFMFEIWSRLLFDFKSFLLLSILARMIFDKYYYKLGSIQILKSDDNLLAIRWKF